MAQTQIQPRGRSALKAWGGGLLGLLLVILMVQYFRDHPGVFDALDHLETGHIAAALLLDVGVIMCFVWRNYVVVNRFSEQPVPYREWFKLHVIGQAINIVFMKVGDAYRAHEAKKKFGLAYTNYASVFILTSWIDMVVIFIMAALLRAVMGGAGRQFLILTGLALAWLLVAPLATLLLRGLNRTRLSPRVAREPMANMLNGFWNAARDRRLLSRILGVVMVSFCVNAGLYLVLFRGLGADIAPFEAALLLAAYKLSQLLAVTPGNLGVREWSLGGVCTLLGLDPGMGLIFSVVLRAIHFLALILALLAAGGPAVLVKAVTIGKRAS